MADSKPTQQSTFFLLVRLLMLILAGAFISMLLGGLLASLFFSTGSADFLKVVQIVSSIGGFIIPAWIFSSSYHEKPASFLKLNTAFHPILAFLVVAIMYSAAPLSEWTIVLNKQMQLPYFLEGLENWMRTQENQLAQLTQQLLRMNSVSDLLLNLIMIALLPALGEELIFRGCFQPIFTRVTNSHHWGIWLAAILFSAIHLQFFGFLPRVLLGALFGYLLLWSNNLWYPILGHFINNATAVLSAYINQQNGKPIEESLAQQGTFPTAVYALSAFLSVATIWIFYQYALQKSANTKLKVG